MFCTETLQEPQVKRALDPEQRDILSAYSSEQGEQCKGHSVSEQPHLRESLLHHEYTTSLLVKSLQLPGQVHYAGFQEMTVDQLKQQLDIGADQLFVLDVRSAWEFSRGRVPGATNISMDDLSSKVCSLRSVYQGSFSW